MNYGRVESVGPEQRSTNAYAKGACLPGFTLLREDSDAASGNLIQSKFSECRQLTI